MFNITLHVNEKGTFWYIIYHHAANIIIIIIIIIILFGIIHSYKKNKNHCYNHTHGANESRYQMHPVKLPGYGKS